MSPRLFSLDLALSNVFLPKQLSQKNALRVRRTSRSQDLITEPETEFLGQTEGLYNQRIREVKQRWEKCIALWYEYTEND